MNNDAILASISKIHAYRYAKEKQRGVKLGGNQLSGSSTTTKFVSNPIPIGTNDFSVEFYGTMYGSNSSYASLFNAVNPSPGGSKTFSFYPQYYPDNGIYGVLFSPDTSGDTFGDQVVVQYKPGNDPKFLVTVTRQGTTVKVYINGELKATKEQSEVKDLGDLQLAIANSSDVVLLRVWNYALSADEITTLYNNGNPLGYVVPKAMKSENNKCIAEYVAPNLIANIVRSQIANIISENSYFWDNVTTGAPSLDIRTNPGIKSGFTYKVNLTVSNFVEGEPYLYAGSKVNITAADGTYDLVITPSEKYDYISVYGGINTQTKNLKITVNSVTLISVASTWLDSAKQLPWSDAYLPPLLQSKGGYDMVAMVLLKYYLMNNL